MVSYFYKNIYKETTCFISCTWMCDIDLTSSSKKPSTPICHLIVTDVRDFYKGTVTYKDLDDFKHGQISLDVLNKLIEVALQGGKEYGGDRIGWKTIFNNNNCQMTLLGYLNNSLPIQVGTFQLDRVSDSEKVQVWTEWMETTASQFKSLKETQETLILHNNNLEQDFEKIKAVADDLVLQKTADNLAMMGKFKELLNEKKRKIRQLELKYKGNDTQRKSANENTSSPPLGSQSPLSSSSSSSATGTTSAKRKNSAATNQQQPPSASKSIKRRRTASFEQPPINNKTPPTVVSPVKSPPSTSEPSQQSLPQALNDDDTDSDRIVKDPLLTTARSKYRRRLKSERQSRNKAGSDSETTEDEATSD